jgi:hypothetical protein
MDRVGWRRRMPPPTLRHHPPFPGEGSQGGTRRFRPSAGGIPCDGGVAGSAAALVVPSHRWDTRTSFRCRCRRIRFRLRHRFRPRRGSKRAFSPSGVCPNGPAASSIAPAADPRPPGGNRAKAGEFAVEMPFHLPIIHG